MLEPVTGRDDERERTVAELPDPLTEYLSKITRELQAGQATEHSYRPALKDLIETLAPDIIATNEPKRVECGAPDYVVQRGQRPIGYIETKDVGSSLNDEARSEQLLRYRRSIHNLLLTDYLAFQWYLDGNLRAQARVGYLRDGPKVTTVRQNRAEVSALLEGFLSHDPPPLRSPAELSVRMARLAHIIRDIIVEAFEAGKASRDLRDLREAFASVLIPDLSRPDRIGQFADIYAQTMVYGLFAARVNHSPERGRFTRLGAAREIPRTNPFLRRLFEIITGTTLDSEPYVDFVDELVYLLATSDLEAILADFGKRTKREDPIIHFYETFLEAYDPALREKRGVYYTPEPIVSFIVRSVDGLLKSKFGLSQGLSDASKVKFTREEQRSPPSKQNQQESRVEGTDEAHRVLILDPACGTGTFLYAVIDHIRDEFRRRGDAGLWSGYVTEHLLPRIFGFELLMAPYAVAHFKLGMALLGHDLPEQEQTEWAYDFSAAERLGVYLTNTLQRARGTWEDLFGPLRIISEEADAASRVKQDLPIMIVLGNPPYSGQPANRSWEFVNGKKKLNFIGDLLRTYYFVDGSRLDERNPKWLQDDYVKFIRWGQWRIERTEAGILGFVTNHGYLDNPTFRGMRQQLLQAFSEIYILDLHGNAKKKERCPDGSKDENVFDIQQGVAIGIFLKGGPEQNGPARVYHADLWGLREEKYERLSELDVESMDWQEISPQTPFYLFVPHDTELLPEYEKGWKVTDIFPMHSVGIATARDRLTIGWTKDELWSTVQDFTRLSPEVARQKYALGKDVRDWKVHLAQEDLRESGPDVARIMPILYRPFDVRLTYYTGRSRGFQCMPRPRVMNNMVPGDNIALITSRMTKGETFRHVQVSRNIVEVICMSPRTSNNGFVFPLYSYEGGGQARGGQKKLQSVGAWSQDEKGRVPNLDVDFVSQVEERLGLEFQTSGQGDLKSRFGPEDVLHYVYAILHSPNYRERYAEFLRIDFPRIPVTSDLELFRKLCAVGEELVALHLLEGASLSERITHYPISGDDLVARGFPKYFAPDDLDLESGGTLTEGRVYINSGQYFDGVPADVWSFHIGGYQPCRKYIKTRVGRHLSYDEKTQYIGMVTALSNTIRFMDDIDQAIPGWPLG